MKDKEWIDLLSSEKDSLNFFGAMTLLTEQKYQLLDFKTFPYRDLRIKSVKKVFNDFSVIGISCSSRDDFNEKKECILWCGSVYLVYK